MTSVDAPFGETESAAPRGAVGVEMAATRMPGGARRCPASASRP